MPLLPLILVISAERNISNRRGEEKQKSLPVIMEPTSIKQECEKYFSNNTPVLYTCSP
jgi:hypothetical protein